MDPRRLMHLVVGRGAAVTAEWRRLASLPRCRECGALYSPRLPVDTPERRGLCRTCSGDAPTIVRRRPGAGRAAHA